jgi:hypothetical protein
LLGVLQLRLTAAEPLALVIVKVVALSDVAVMA